MWINNTHLLIIKHTAYINFSKFLLLAYTYILFCRWNIHETIISRENKGNHSAMIVTSALWRTFTTLFLPFLLCVRHFQEIFRVHIHKYNRVKWNCFVLCILTPDYKFFSHDHHHQQQQTLMAGENVVLKKNYCELSYNDN